MEAIRAKNNSTSSSVFGTAERGSTVSMAITNERICPKNGTDVINNNNSNFLKDLSMSEIVKIAEARTKIAGISRQPTDNPWRKRMAISENITRRETTLNTQLSSQGVELTMAENELDEEFFENLLQKITSEQFIPRSGTDRSRKRIRLWDKENLIPANTKKCRKEGRANAKLTPPKMVFFKRRLLPQQNNNSSLEAVNTRSGPQQDQEISIPQNKFTPDLFQDINMTEFSLRFTKSNPSSATTESVGESLYRNQTVEDCVSICTQETFKLERDYLVDNIDHDSVYKASPSHYYAEKYPKYFWDSSRLSTIEEDHELPIVVETSVVDAVNMEFDAPLLTPPSSVEFTDCEVCHSAEGEHGYNGNNNYSPFPSMAMMGDADGEIFEISDETLFT